MGNRVQQGYQDWIEGLELGIAIVSSTGRIRYANSRFSEILGISPDALRPGRRLMELLDAWSAASFISALSDTRNGRVDGQIEVLHDQKRRIVRALFDRIKDDGQTIRIVISEITKAVETSITLQKYEASVQSLSARILQLQDEERRRIARELHDTSGQDLAVMLMSLDQLGTSLQRNGTSDGMRQIHSDVVSLARKIEEQIRTLSYVLHPPLLDELGLGAALRWYVEGFTKRTGITVEVLAPQRVPRLALQQETALFRVVQECLSNILRHSGSSRARVRFSIIPGMAEVFIRDFGKGMPAHTLSEAGKGKSLGVGIAGMRERLEQLGGTIELRSGARGTTVIARLPAEIRQSADEEPASEPVPHTLPESPSDLGEAPKRILVVEDHEVTRRGIKALLESQPDLQVCGEAEDGIQAAAKTADLRPDLVLLDLAMPRAGGFSAIRHIHRTSRKTKILVFTNHAHSSLITTLRAVGCDGYVSKGKASAELVRGIRTVLAGNKFFGP